MAQIIEIEGDRVFTSKTIFNELITNGSAVSPINTFSGDGSQTVFILSKTPFDSDNLSVIVDDTPMIQDTDYTYEVVSDNPTITFTTAPPSGTNNIVIGETFTYEPNKYKYYLAAHYYDSDEVDNRFVAKPTNLILTDGSTVTLADNTEYSGTVITDLTFAFPNSKFECYISLTTASSGTISITFPQTAKYIGEAPTFSNDEEWEISIKNGVIVAGKVE